jgi:hypothetical protein
VYDCVVRSLRSHTRIDPVTKPAEGAKDQEPDQKPKQNQNQKQKPDQKIAAFGSSYSWIECYLKTRSAAKPPSRAGSLPQKQKQSSAAAAAKPPHSTMSASSSAFDLRATSEG